MPDDDRDFFSSWNDFLREGVLLFFSRGFCVDGGVLEAGACPTSYPEVRLVVVAQQVAVLLRWPSVGRHFGHRVACTLP